MKKVIIFGCGKISDVMYTCISENKNYCIAAFTVDQSYLQSNQKFGVPVVPFEEVEQFYPPASYDMLIAIGYEDLNRVRAERYHLAKTKGYKLISYVDSRAIISPGVSIGDNCIIMGQVSIGPLASIGNNVSIYNGSIIAHHSDIKDNCWITSSVVGGNTTIGRNTFLGINAIVGHNISVGEENFIGAGTMVTKTTENKAVFVREDTPKHRLNSNQFLQLFNFR